MFDAVVFAGGGNRCYWQQGFWEAAAGPLGLAPSLVVGASAGAFQAGVSLLGIGGEVRPLVVEGCRDVRGNIDWRALARGAHAFPVAAAYRALLLAAYDLARLDRLASLTDFRIAIAHPPRWLPTGLAIALGIGAYQIEKKLTKPVHPRSGRAMGFVPSFVRLADLPTPEALADTLMASAGVPPIMPRAMIGGRVAVDGGLVDNVPVAPVEPIEALGGRSLVLLTRRYPRLPEVPGRTYVQPSRPIAIGQFDLTNPEGILAAHALGREDGAAFVAAMRAA